MTKTEAFCLAAQINIVLPKKGYIDALFTICEELGYSIGLEEYMKNGQAIDSFWVIEDSQKNEIARCA